MNDLLKTLHVNRIDIAMLRSLAVNLQMQGRSVVSSLTPRMYLHAVLPCLFFKKTILNAEQTAADVRCLQTVCGGLVNCVLCWVRLTM